MRAWLVVGALFLGACASNGALKLGDSFVGGFQCDRGALEQEWAAHRHRPAVAGESVCLALGRFGTPAPMSFTEQQGAQIVSMAWRDRHYSIVGVRPTNVAVAQKLGIPLGAWTITRVLVH